MPYRLQGNCVQVKRTTGWQNLKCHGSREEAMGHLAALKSNVKESSVKSPKKKKNGY